MSSDHPGARCGGGHLVQLFDGFDSLADGVSAFLVDGLLAGDPVLVVSTMPHWALIAGRLRARGAALEQSLRSGQLTVRDATEALGQFMRHGRADRRLFHESMGALVRDRAFLGRPLRAYAELVDVLATEGDYRTALEVEELLEDLGERVPFTLLCGYSAVNFGNPRYGEVLRAICARHSGVRANPRDILASFLLGAGAPEPATP
jgi:hypothetical protein